jgi:glycosyltransferase involved in cell wall biosynthesis
LRFGGGMKGKVIEAMRFGLPCVTTSTGAQGLDSAVAFLAVADSAQAFADQVERLACDDQAWTVASVASQTFARERFSEQALWNIVAADIGLAS